MVIAPDSPSVALVRYVAAALSAALVLTACTGEAGPDADEQGWGQVRTYVAAEETVWDLRAGRSLRGDG